MKRISLIAGLLACFGFCGAASAINLVINGGFERPDIPNGFTVSSSLPGWTITGDPLLEIFQNHISVGSAYEGDQFIQLERFIPVTISQQIATVTGQSYDLQFAYSRRELASAVDNRMRVLWSGNELFDLAIDGTGLTFTDWQLFQTTVSATANFMTLEFENAGPGTGRGPLLDAVALVVSPIPEPTTLALLTLGLAGIAFSRRKTLH